MKKVDIYLLIFLNSLLLIFVSIFTFIIAGIGIMEYGVSPFNFSFILLYILLLSIVFLLIYSILLLKRNLIKNKWSGYFFIGLGALIMFLGILDFTQLGLVAWLRPVLFSLVSLDLVLLGATMLKKTKNSN